MLSRGDGNRELQYATIPQLPDSVAALYRSKTIALNW
jgi:hypothetical protein